MESVIQKINAWRELKNVDEKLDLSSYGLTSLDFIIDDIQKCTFLFLDANNLTSLPDLPNCKTLYCRRNNLTHLSELPKCRILYCSHNKLTRLPDLPECVDLDCSDNLLTELPKIPKCIELWCSENKLTKLPNMDNMVDLKCNDNQLKVLPELPKCEKLECTNCRLRYLPPLPMCRYINYLGNSLFGIPLLDDNVNVQCIVFLTSMCIHLRKFSTMMDILKDKKHLHDLMKFHQRQQVDMVTVNYNLFAFKIEKAWMNHKRRKVFKALHENYIKNVSTVISQYVV